MHELAQPNLRLVHLAVTVTTLGSPETRSTPPGPCEAAYAPYGQLAFDILSRGSVLTFQLIQLRGGRGRCIGNYELLLPSNTAHAFLHVPLHSLTAAGSDPVGRLQFRLDLQYDAQEEWVGAFRRLPVDTDGLVVPSHAPLDGEVGRLILPQFSVQVCVCVCVHYKRVCV